MLPGVGLAQCCSTGQTACAVGNRAWGYLCYFLVPSCRCPPTREVTEVKKKKNYFFKHPVVMLCLPLQQPQLLTFFLPLCSWHPLHRAPAWVTLTAETLSPAMCAVCLAGLCTCLGSFLADVMDVANKSWGLSVLSSCTTFNSMFLLHSLI